jgi:simple sugar transport system permease protein
MRSLAARPELSIVVVTALAAAWFSATTDHFAGHANLTTLLPFFAPFAILATGEVLLMISGEIDLSIGSFFLFTPLMVHVFAGAGLPLLPAVALALGCAAAVGLLNGLFTELMGVSSFITTLGTLLGLGGLTLVISGAAPVAMPGAEITSRTVEVAHVVNGVRISVPEQVNHIGSFAEVFGGGAASELIWALAIVAAVQVVLSLTRWGRHTIAVGGNRLAAAELGVGVRRVVIRNFVLCSVLAGLVGILEAVRTSTVTPDTAASSEIMFRALSAAVIGGTLLAGGTGSAVGALFGALFLGILRDGLTLKGVDAQYLDLILGIAILGAMALSVRIARARTEHAGA